MQAAHIPFLFMTNGGGHFEEARAAQFSDKFGVPVSEWQICQSHTPMRALAERHGDEMVLLVRGTSPDLPARRLAPILVMLPHYNVPSSEATQRLRAPEERPRAARRRTESSAQR